MITQIKTLSITIKVWKLEFKLFGSNTYLLKIKNKKLLIDPSSHENKNELILKLRSLDIKPSDIDILLLTHNHWDHTQNINFFLKSNPSLKIYGNEADFGNKEFSKVKNINKIEQEFP